MKKYLFFFFFFGSVATTSFGQKFYSKTGHIHFLSKAPIETIESDNHNGYVVFDASTGQLEFSVLIKGFKFEKALMQQHFNENYMESDKYPKSVLKGSLFNWSISQLEKDGAYNVNVEGQLMIRGITKPFKCPARLTVKGGVISASAAFDVVIADYGIQVPKVVRDNISKTVKVAVNADLQPMNVK